MKLDEVAPNQRSTAPTPSSHTDATERPCVRRVCFDRIAGVVLGCAITIGILAPDRAHAGDLDLAVALEGGAAWTESRFVYRSLDSDDSSGVVSHWGPAGALEIALTGRLHGALRLGGVLRGGLAEGTMRFSEVGELQLSMAVGPTLRLESDDPEHGPYGGIWAGLSVLSSYGLGWGGGLDVGYRWTLPEDLSLGIGVAVTTQWNYDDDLADHGRYEFVQRSVWPSLQVRVAHGLLP